ncbi:2,4-dienoyl-CoA reductase-like NADH-dependent reductase (Old Yellow Enzyme family) [Crossiella equi]|uniref:2,4-dienoyl-CoA reductase-like NADH-dependent reductase (Old Yellow Enzyme family) n=1 Tax=Crossiella equi TaxID=130796 RepID=A0ABS5ARN7_9PSEU|nr:NADH:flavin oxidoreductase/NADH oxidase [Crossiella equi]MBP2478884.1 2,4-dienoyl-CoA reductase-like NADH-dependent reductase (Old Yellow Enzyme family) [Crossiella equi]
MSKLFEPLRLRSVTFPNRLWLSPLCMYSAADTGELTGAPTDFHLTHLASRAAGGAGLVMAEASAVSPEGRISPFDLGLWNDTQREAFARVTSAVKAHGAVPGIQLAHAGRKASIGKPWLGGKPVGTGQGGWVTRGASPVAFEGYPVPHELSVEEIQEVVATFAQAAVRAREAGFEVVEIHGAHGYLLHSFLSPASNQRTDAYGGSFENRTRLAVEVVEAVRAVWPEELPLFFRVSGTDWITETHGEGRPAWTPADTQALAALLKTKGVDLVDVSSGGLVRDVVIPADTDYQTRLAGPVRAASGVAVATVGRVTEARQAEELVASGQADAVFVGRQLLRDAYWPNRVAVELGATPRVPEQYAYAV